MNQTTAQPLTRNTIFDLSSRELLNKLDEYRQLASECCADWAEKKVAYGGKKDLLNSHLAAIQIDFQDRYPKKSQTELKTMALASPEYIKLVTEMTQAHFELSKAEGEYKGLMKSLDALTAISYVVNNEVKLSR